MLILASSIECRSGHPLADAIVRKAKENNISIEANLEEFADVTGKGVKAKINGQQCFAGSARFLQENEISTHEQQNQIADLEDQGKTTILIGQNGKLLGILAIADALRPGAKETLSIIRKQGTRTVMLTGDNEDAPRPLRHRQAWTNTTLNCYPKTRLELLRN